MNDSNELTATQKHLLAGLNFLDLPKENKMLICLALNNEQMRHMILWLAAKFKKGEMPTREVVMDKFLSLHNQQRTATVGR